MDTQPALCFTCHAAGTGASTNVVDGQNKYNSLALRGGGFTNAMIDGAGASKSIGTVIPPGGHGLPTTNQLVPALAAPSAVTSKHQIDGTTTGTMWGNGAISPNVNLGKPTVTLECGSCHDPHGNGNYRILKPVPVDAGTLVQTIISPATTNATTGVVTPAELSAPPEGVNIPDAVSKVYTTDNYWTVADRQVPTVKGSTTLPAAGVTDGYIANVSQWCATCHTRYLAGSGSYKTDSGDAVFTYRHRSNRNNSAGVSRPNCIQCHVSHGSNVTMTGDAATVALPGGGLVSAAPSSDSRLLRVNNRGTCVMCHNV